MQTIKHGWKYYQQKGQLSIVDFTQEEIEEILHNRKMAEYYESNK